MKARRWQRRVAVFSACVCLLAACAKSSDDSITLRFWTMGREGEVVGSLLRDFERLHPGVRIDVQQLPITAAHEKLLTAFAGDALPDIGQIGNTWMPELATLGALEPLQSRVDASTIVDQSDYFAGIWDSNVIDDRLYGVPWYVDTRLLFYRKDLLAEAGFPNPPHDWAEWARQMAALKQLGGEKKYSILLPLDEYESLLNLAVQESDPLLRDDDTRGNFESAGFRRAFAFYIDMYREGWAPVMSATQISNVWDEFAKGFFAFHITGPWNVGEYSRRLPARLKDDWGTAALPGPNGPGAAVGGGSSLVMFKGTKHPDAVWQLIEFLSEPSQQLRFHQLSGDLPPRRSTWSDPTLANDQYAAAFRDQLERVKSAPKVPEWERIAQAMRLMTERVVRGKQSSDEALKALDTEVDGILEKRRWMIEQHREPK